MDRRQGLIHGEMDGRMSSSVMGWLLFRRKVGWMSG